MSSSKGNLINILYHEAQKSLIDQHLAAAITKGNKILSKPCCNSVQNCCRGNCFGSLHAEARAIVNYFGRSLSFDKKNGWCLKPGQIKETKT
jgi:hypothetical protein